jgi:periplasmic divalent cation tolerance protein
MSNTYLLVLNTCPNRETAEKIASTLVDCGLAPCVNIIPGITSVYKWQGKREVSQEFLLLVKTRADAYKSLEKSIKELHPYELPEIISVPLAYGLADYLAWIDKNTVISR